MSPVSAELADHLDEDGNVKVCFVANPTQRLFIESRARADLFSCRMGEGKSAALCWAIWFHTSNNPGARWLVIRDTWENCRETTQVEFFKWFPPVVTMTSSSAGTTCTNWLPLPEAESTG